MLKAKLYKIYQYTKPIRTIITLSSILFLFININSQNNIKTERNEINIDIDTA